VMDQHQVFSAGSTLDRSAIRGNEISLGHRIKKAAR
jgi:hypothetical protein